MKRLLFILLVIAGCTNSSHNADFVMKCVRAKLSIPGALNAGEMFACEDDKVECYMHNSGGLSCFPKKDNR